MANYRAVRVGDEIKTKISEIIPTLKDPRINGIVSVTRVEVSNDAKYATCSSARWATKRI